MKDLLTAYQDRLVLVTGAGGFIGSHLVEGLVGLGARVRALDHQPREAQANLAAVIDRIDYVQRSLGEDSPLDDVVGGCDYVFHLAANASVPLSAEQPALDFELNVGGTYRVMEALRRTGAGRLIFPSTASVYGEPVRDPMDESHPLRPQSPYAGSKLAAEFLLDAYARCYGFDHVRARLFSTFGPRQRKYVMFDLLEKLRRDPRRLEILGTGRQMRTYSYVADTVQALLHLGAHPDARGEVFNIGGEQPLSIRELAELIVETIGIEPPEMVFTGQSWPGDVQRLIGDWSRLRGLGYRPAVGLREGLRRLVEWHRSEYAPPW